MEKLLLLAVSLAVISVSWTHGATAAVDEADYEVVPDLSKPEELKKYLQDNVPQVPRAPAVPHYSPDATRLNCPQHMVKVTAGLRRYYNPKNYNMKGQKCDYTWGLWGTSKCDPIFHTTYTYQYQGSAGNSMSERLETVTYGPFTDSTEVLFVPQFVYQVQVCAVPDSMVRIGLDVRDDDVTTQSERIGQWDFQFTAIRNFGEHVEIKRSQKSGADITVFFQS